MKQHKKQSLSNRKIFICHQSYEPSHFLALYREAEKYGYEVADYLILDPKTAVKTFLKEIKQNGCIYSLKVAIGYLPRFHKLLSLKNQIVIIGLAPYDYLLNFYSFLIKRNNCIYFTSWQNWTGSEYPKGSVNNKQYYELVLSKKMKGIACVSSCTYNQVSCFNNNTVIVNHSVEIEKYAINLKNRWNDKKKYIYIGQLIERKNISLILNWINQNSNMDFEFCFAGDGVLKDEIVKIASYDDRVTYVGVLKKEDIYNCLTH